MYDLSGHWRIGQHGHSPGSSDCAATWPSPRVVVPPAVITVEEARVRAEMERRLVVRGWLVPRSDRRIA